MSEQRRYTRANMLSRLRNPRAVAPVLQVHHLDHRYMDKPQDVIAKAYTQSVLKDQSDWQLPLFLLMPLPGDALPDTVPFLLKLNSPKWVAVQGQVQ